MPPPVDDPASVKILLWLAAGLPTAVAMEYWSRLLHGQIWHRWLWFMHASHHTPHAPGQRYEVNDLLSFTHAPIAIAAILYGCLGPVGPARELLFGFGLGMTLFGLSYIVVHDGLVHGRLPAAWLLRFRFFRRVRAAHEVHHRHGGVPYGLFRGPEELKAARRRGAPGARTSAADAPIASGAPAPR
jgi:beta-carotene 3-hydroxylase